MDLCFPSGYQMKCAMPSDANSSPVFQAVKPVHRPSTFIFPDAPANLKGLSIGELDSVRQNRRTLLGQAGGRRNRMPTCSDRLKPSQGPSPSNEPDDPGLEFALIQPPDCELAGRKQNAF